MRFNIKDIFRKAKRSTQAITQVREMYSIVSNDLKSAKINLGQIQAYQNNQRASIAKLSDVEFQVFSQWGDDGIIQYLINKIDLPHKTFVEFGVENYKESNTRFLLINDKWHGLVLDGSKESIEYIKRDTVSLMYHLYAKEAFITKENINSLIDKEFLQKGYDPEIGILSVDLDGNDYWIWKEINVVKPVIVVLEYNAIYGAEKPWTIPYKGDFVWGGTAYWGSSLKAHCEVSEKKGYYFIGCNSNGNNAYFIRKDKIGNLKPVSCSEGYSKPAFRLYKNEQGERMSAAEALEQIRGMEIFNVETNQLEKI
jgi:hypothetical protein